MNCAEMRDLYALYALGVLEDDESKVELRAHLLRHCPECSAGVKSAALLGGDLGLLAPAAEPSAKLRQKVLASVGAVHESRRLLTFAFATAACGLAAAVFIGVQAEKRREASRQTEIHLSAENARLSQAIEWFSLPETRQAVFGPGAEPSHAPPGGRVLVNSRLGVLLLASRLQPLPAGKIYELWIIPKGRSPQPAGLFQPSPSGPTVFLRSGPLDAQNVAAIAVSIEPGAGSSSPTTTPILVAAL